MPRLTGFAHWTAALSRDRRTISLGDGGATWVTGLRVEITAADPKLSSTALETSLLSGSSFHAGHWIFDFRGPVAYEIVLSSDGEYAVELQRHACRWFPCGQTRATLN